MPQNPYQPFLDAMTPKQRPVVGSGFSTPDDGTFHDPSGMVELNSLLDQRKDELTKNLSRSQGDPNFGTGGDLSDLHTILTDQAPMEAQRQETNATNAANTQAIQQGFGGTKDIAVDYTGPVKPALQGGDISTAGAVGDSQMPMQRQAGAERQAAFAKLILPNQVAAQGNLAVERQKGANELAMQDQGYNRMMEERHRSGLGGPTPPEGNTPSPAAPAGPPQSQGWMDYLTGKGPNSASSALDATNERLKYGTMATPYAPLMQDVSFQNLQQLAGQFPGVRGFQQLIPLMAQHQANVGKGESWLATYQRLKGMDRIMGDTVNQFDDPSLTMKMGPTGRLEMTTPPQTVLRGKLALHDAHIRTQDAIKQLERLHPELLGQQPEGAAGPQAGAGPKMIVDEQGNLVPKVR